jgi:peroxiredoxin
MAKKGVKSRAVKRLSNREVQLALIENFVNLQKVLTNLTMKFDLLSDNISKLLQIFELSAKSFLRKYEEGMGEERDVLKKLDILLDQNKTIAKGLTLIEEKIRHKVYGSEKEEQSLSEFGISPARPRPRPFPRL